MNYQRIISVVVGNPLIEEVTLGQRIGVVHDDEI